MYSSAFDVAIVVTLSCSPLLAAALTYDNCQGAAKKLERVKTKLSKKITTHNDI